MKQSPTPCPAWLEHLDLRGGVLALALLLQLHLLPRTHAAPLVPPNDEELRKIAHAVPAQSSIRPASPRKLLVFTLCRGYVHASIPFGAKAVELMGERTGAFQATVSDDIAFFEPEKLRQFDGVCLMSALGEFFLPENLATLPTGQQEAVRNHDERLKANFYAWLRAGKGLAAIHGGCYAFNGTPAFAELFGGAFANHPWNADEKIAVKLDEPTHPVVAAFGGCGIELIDEGYQFKAPYSRSTVRVLYSLDLSRMDLTKPNLRPDHDFGLCWVKKYGEGRVFFSALGHNNEEYWNPTLLRHFLDGIQFALGDLSAETAPLGAAAPAR
jgi:type 1 glutamine amidotransferase